jgi:hypothetical protein
MRVALISILGLFACGEDGVSVSTTSDNFCSEIAEVACHNLYQCCTEGEIESYLGVQDPRTEVQCREDAKTLCERKYYGVVDSIREKRVSFDGAKLDACLTAMVAPDGVCSDVVMEVPWTTACKENPFVGQVAIGGTCLFAYDCAGSPKDTFCGTDQKCKAKPTAGFPCTGSNCADGLYCSSTNSTWTPRGALGAPCTQTNECGEELYCDTSQTMPVCADPKMGGEECTSNAGCKSNKCIPGMCAGSTFDSCFKDSDCDKRCGGNGNVCNTASDCGNGTCTNFGTTCNEFTTCPSGSQCVYPTDCVAVECVGDPVCTLEYVPINYCSAVTGSSSMF